MTAMIIGGAGLVGMALARTLGASGVTTTVLDSFRSSRALTGDRAVAYHRRLDQVREHAEVVECDVRDDTRLREVIAERRPSVVYYLAALLASESENNPEEARAVQLDGLATTVSLLEENGSPYRLVSASSSFIYGDFRYAPADEDHPLAPIGVYGEAKLRAERFLKEADLACGQWIVLRPSSVYGIGDPRDRFATVAIEQAATTGRFSCAYPGFVSDFTYVTDVAQAFALAGGEGFTHGEVLNVSRGEAWTTEEFCAVVQQAVPGSEFTIDDWTGVAPERGALDCRRANRVLGWTSHFDLAAGVAECISDVRAVFPAGTPAGAER